MMIDRSVSVVIHFDDGRARQICSGPTPQGRCVRAQSGDLVACAGGMIFALRGTVADGRRLVVELKAGPGCPLAPLVRVVPAPWD